jgi:transcription antitermination factor NusG
MESPIWFVAHTRPRCEKKLAEYCDEIKVSTTLPLYKSVRKYRGKKVVFEKPLFPSYVFLQAVPEQRGKIYQSKHVRICSRFTINSFSFSSSATFCVRSTRDWKFSWPRKLARGLG